MTFLFFQSRKGISPLIASVLLIVFTISIATLIVTWLNNYTASTTEEVDQSNQQFLECSKQRPLIDNVFANSSSSTKPIVRVAVRNAGTDSFTLKSLQVFGEDGTTCTGFGVNDRVMTVGNSSVFNFTEACAVNCTTFQLARVTTTCGPSSNEFAAKSLIVGCS